MCNVIEFRSGVPSIAGDVARQCPDPGGYLAVPEPGQGTPDPLTGMLLVRCPCQAHNLALEAVIDELGEEGAAEESCNAGQEDRGRNVKVAEIAIHGWFGCKRSVEPIPVWHGLRVTGEAVRRGSGLPS